MIDQLPLNIQLRDDATLLSYYSGENQEALNAVTKMAAGQGEFFLYLWGQLGVGRTHLCQAACHAAAVHNKSAFYLSLEENTQYSIDIFQGLENLDLVCIDDIDKISGNAKWEEALFHFFNRIQFQKGRLLIAADVAPKELKIHLLDLKSRLASGVTYQLHRLDDEQKISALQLRAEQRGIKLTKTVGQFLLSRCSRNMSELFNTLEKLDRASLAEQRRLTIPFIKEILEI